MLDRRLCDPRPPPPAQVLPLGYVVLRRRAGAAHSAGEDASADSLQLAKEAAQKKAAAAALAKEKEEAAQKKAAAAAHAKEKEEQKKKAAAAALAKEKEEQKKAAEVCTQRTPVPLVVGKPGV